MTLKGYSTDLTHFSPSDASNSELPDRYQEALAFLYDRINYEKLVTSGRRYPFRLRRMVDLLVRLNLNHWVHPSHLQSDSDEAHLDESSAQRLAATNLKAVNAEKVSASQPVPIVHIAGTKGKGSTATMVASALTAAGIKTGVYTSPHLHQLEERFRIDGQLCSPAELVGLVNHVRSVAGEMAKDDAGEPTFFELTTAIALLHFHRCKCQAVVLEVGLGGRLDSTNVCLPAVSVITSIGLDHQHVLGDTKELIAAEKAGIIKPGVPVVCGVTESGPQSVIADIAQTNHAALYQLDRDFKVESEPDSDWGSRMSFIAKNPHLTSVSEIQLSLEGDHQTRNASLAIAVIQILTELDFHQINDDALRSAMANLSCDGRIQRYRLPNDVTVIVDAAHNDDSISALCQAIRKRTPKHTSPITFIFGTSIDKDAQPMLQRISELADNLILTRFIGNPRFADPENLRPLISASWCGNLMVDSDPLSACRTAVENAVLGSTIVLCGSFFLVAETQQWFASQVLKEV